MSVLWAKQALTADGWLQNVRIVVRDDGRIAAVDADQPAEGQQLDVLVLAPVNSHSHAFQRAMAGLTERRGANPTDSFWTWRNLMYRFLDQVTPEQVQAIAGLVQMEMLEAGFGTNVEFHYLHHQADGTPYDRLSEMADRVAAAAELTGIGLTLLSVACTWQPLRYSCVCSFGSGARYRTWCGPLTPTGCEPCYGHWQQPAGVSSLSRRS